MSKEVKVIASQGNGNFDYDGKTYYSFEYTLENENGQQGQFFVNHMTPEAKFKEGETVLFEDKGLDKKGNKKAGLKSLNSGGYSGGGGSSYKKKQPSSNNSFALSYAKDVYVAHGASVELKSPDEISSYITAVADGLLKWLNENK